MKIEKTIEENHEAKLVVEIEPDMMDKYKRKAARKLSERGKIPGFRPGKAPYDMVVRTYGEQPVVEQAVDFMIDAEYSNILSRSGCQSGCRRVARIDRFPRPAQIHFPGSPGPRSGPWRLSLDPPAV